MASRPGQQGGSRERVQHPTPSHSSLVGSGGGTSGISSTTHPTHSSSVIQNQGRQLFFIFLFFTPNYQYIYMVLLKEPGPPLI